jgi:signal transduction histidine kinase
MDVELVTTTRAAMTCVRRNEYGVLLLEESLTTADPEAAEILYRNAGGALLIEINFVLSNTERILRQVRNSLARREQDRFHARTAVVSQLTGELNSTLAGLLLQSQLALREAQPELQPKLRNIIGLASDLRKRLKTDDKMALRR